MPTAATVVMVGPASRDRVFHEPAAAVAAAGHRVIRHTDIKTFAADPDALADADVLFGTSTMPCTHAMIERAPRLRAVLCAYTGVELIDIPAATAHCIVVGNTQTRENYESLAEATILLMLASLYDLHGVERVLRKDLPRPDPVLGRMLRRRTVGLIGFGQSARAIARKLAAWEVDILVSMPRLHGDLPANVTRVELDDLLRRSDVVSVHCALNGETRGLIDARRLKLIKPDAVFINTSRGGIVDDAALCDLAVENPRLRLALDVFGTEPLPLDSPFRRLPNAILTPHMISLTEEHHIAGRAVNVEDLRRVLLGIPPVYPQNPEVLPAWTARYAQGG